MKILKFGADWCPECAIMRPRWLEVEREFPGLEIEYFDVDKCKAEKKEMAIDHVPTFIFLNKNGEEIDRLRGLVEVKDLISKINEHKEK